MIGNGAARTRTWHAQEMLVSQVLVPYLCHNTERLHDDEPVTCSIAFLLKGSHSKGEIRLAKGAP